MRLVRLSARHTHTHRLFTASLFLTLCISPSSSPFVASLSLSLYMCLSFILALARTRPLRINPSHCLHSPLLPISLPALFHKPIFYPCPPLSIRPFYSPSSSLFSAVILSFLSFANFIFLPPSLATPPLPFLVTPLLHPSWRPLNGQLRGKSVEAAGFSPNGLICRGSPR